MRRGYTLIELMIVVAIVGVSAAVVSPSRALTDTGRPAREAVHQEQAREALAAAVEATMAEDFDDLAEQAGSSVQLVGATPVVDLQRRVSRMSSELVLVELTASWSERNQRRSRSVVTLRGDHPW